MPESFRPARPAELAGLAALANHSFPSPERGAGWWQRYLGEGPHGGVESLWVAEQEGEIVGACQLLRLRQWIAGEALPVMGLGAVTIAPTHRRRGLAERLVVAGFREARERGDLASALYPFRIGYYQGLGYGLAGEAHQYRVPPRMLPDDPTARGRVRLVRSADERTRLMEVYAAGARRQTGQIERTAESWRGVLEGDDRAAVVYEDEAGQAQGYAVIRYRADLPAERRYLEVEERMWLTGEARRGLYAWLSSLGDQWRELLYRAHPDERFGDVVQEPRLPPGGPGWGLWFPSATLLRGPMFRLLDVAKALPLRNIRPAAEVSLRVEVDDEQLPENRGAWRLTLGGERLRVEPAGAERAGGATLSLPVSVLSRLFVGALTAAQAVEAGAARVEGPVPLAELDRALCVPPPWTFERF